MKHILLIFLLSFIASCTSLPLTTTQGPTVTKSLVYQDFDYESNVGLVQLYPTSSNDQASLDYPVISTNGSGLTLSFDLLEENYRYINARYIHCNADWSKSPLTSIQFVNNYNEFTINNYQYSSNTRIPYVNYTAQLPSPKISGNYLLILYNEGNEDDMLFVRRFCVFEQHAKIYPELLRSSLVAKRQSNQQLKFSVNYEGINNPNPLQDFKVVLLQNHNWNTAVREIKPTIIRNDQQYIEYDHFNGQNNFSGLNEFRYFDLRSIDYRGMNVKSTQKYPEYTEALLNLDKPRRNLAYAQINKDLNGMYFLQNTDPNDSQFQSEYVKVNFELSSEEIPGEVFISGQLVNWTMSPKNNMYYDYESGYYKGTLLLKQGYYNYLYLVRSDSLPADYIEGSNYQTENNYEIFFYYRNPSNNYDELIGYRKLSSRN